MALPTLTPDSTTSRVILPITGTLTTAQSTTSYAFGIFADSDNADYYDANFISGALDQVAYTYKKLGGDVLDVELTEENIYSAYEEAVLEYGYLVNLHQAKNMLKTALGNTTGTFDHDGALQDLGGDSEKSGSHVSLKYPKFHFSYAKNVSQGFSQEGGFGHNQAVYSASFTPTEGQQDYDLQNIISASAADSENSGFEYYNKVGNKKILIKKVFYKTPHAMWRFYGYYGGLNAVGNLSNYGQYSDDSTWEVIPTWQNKLQAMAYEDAIYTRNSHFSYEIRNNKLRIYPSPHGHSPAKMWIQFVLPSDSWEEESDLDDGHQGVNNLNTLPFGNIPYKNINSIGKQWIRRFGLAIAKEMLGQIRGKFSTIPIPGESITLNHSELLSQSKEEQEKLREELKTIMDELTYNKLAETEAEIVKNSSEVMQQVPAGIFVG
tara:strand:+ start:19 stop:1323 length:1305 start_codon:yes stop_codon:yes gene_type:complete